MSAPRAVDAGLVKPVTAPADYILAEALANFGTGILREGLSEEGARANFERAVELVPDSVRVYFYLTRYYLARGQRELALNLAQQAAEQNPSAVEAWLLLAHLAQAAQRYDLALSALQRSIELVPDNVTNYLQLAAVHLAQNDEAAAIRVLEQARSQVEDPVPLQRVLGDLYAARAVREDLPPRERHQALQRAVQAYEADAASASDVLWAEYRHKLGDLYLLDGQIGRAALLFADLLADNHTDSEARAKLLACVMEQGLPPDLAVRLQQTAQSVDRADFWMYQGHLFESIGDMAGAQATYSAALEADPDDPLPAAALAASWAGSDPVRAMNLLRDALARNPGNMTLLDLLARLLLAQNRGPEALVAFERLQGIVGDPESEQLTAAFFAGYAEAARLSGRPERALRLYERALLRDPLHLDAYVGLALLHLEQGQKDPAMAVMRQALAELPEHPGAHYLTGLLANRAGDYELARSVFARVAELEEQSAHTEAPALAADFYFNYGAACERGGLYEQAEDLLLRAMALDDRHAEAFNYLAYMWAEQGRKLEQALFYAEHALELEPENGAFLDTLGWVLFQMGRLEEALEKIAAALLRLPEDPVVLEHYGDIHHALGNVDEAVQWWLRSRQAGAPGTALDEKLRAAGVETEKNEDNPAADEDEQQQEKCND